MNYGVRPKSLVPSKMYAGGPRGLGTPHDTAISIFSA